MNASARLSEFFAQVGHTYTHLMTALFPTVALVLGPQFGITYGEALALAYLGSFLFGAGSLPAGWLSDRWSAPGMMVVFYLGTGAAAILTGLAASPAAIATGLALLGLFASVYHPVGMAWLVRTAENRGRSLGVNGVYGSIGFASAGVLAGWLTDLVSWRAAFIVPGVVCVLTAVVLFVLIRTGRVVDGKTDRRPEAPPQRDALIRAFVVMSLTMLCTGLIWACYSAAMPKFFAERVPSLSGGTAAGAGTLVSVAYLFAMFAQLAGGHIADRFRLRSAYLAIYALIVPTLFLAAGATGIPGFAVLVGALLLSTLAVPIENSLLSRYSPEKWRATLFGVKFVLSSGVSAAALPLVGTVHDRTGDFYWLFVLLAAVATLVVAAGFFLPREAPRPRAVPAGHEA